MVPEEGPEVRSETPLCPGGGILKPTQVPQGLGLDGDKWFRPL